MQEYEGLVVIECGNGNAPSYSAMPALVSSGGKSDKNVDALKDMCDYLSNEMSGIKYLIHVLNSNLPNLKREFEDAKRDYGAVTKSSYQEPRFLSMLVNHGKDLYNAILA